MMSAEQVCNILVAGNDPMTTTGPQVRALVEELFGRVDIVTMRAGVELAEPSSRDYTRARTKEATWLQ
jgi:hypothetical protein